MFFIKRKGIVAAQSLFIQLVGLAVLAVAHVGARILQPFPGREHAVLRIGNRRLDHLRRKFLVTQLHGFCHGLDDGHAVILVIDDKFALPFFYEDWGIDASAAF